MGPGLNVKCGEGRHTWQTGLWGVSRLNLRQYAGPPGSLVRNADCSHEVWGQ